MSIPLTEDNLLHLGNQQKINVYNKETLQRYYQDVDFFNKTSTGLNSYHSSAPLIKCDVIPPSPFLKDPFTSDFLLNPVTENVYYKSCSLTPKRSFVSQADSLFVDSQTLSDGKSFMSRSATTDNESESDFSIFTSPSFYHERRSLPAKLHKKESLKELRRVPSLDTYSIASAQQKEDRMKSRHTSKQSITGNESNKKRKKTWLKRILRIFNKTEAKHQPVDVKNPVWYCQYSKNPNTCFENYYKNQQINIVS